MPTIVLQLRRQLINDSLSSVLATAGFSVLSEWDVGCGNVIVIIDADDYAPVTQKHNGRKIVVLANESDCRGLNHEQIAALHGILTYDLSAEAFVRSLRLLCSGERVFPRQLSQRSRSQTSSHQACQPRYDADRLTPRDREILSHLVEGHSNKEIARILGITEATVKIHLKSLLRKIGVENRTQAVIWALANLPELEIKPPGFV